MPHLVFDVRGQRKFPSEDHSLHLIVDQSSSGISIDVDGIIRVLVKKH